MAAVEQGVCLSDALEHAAGAIEALMRGYASQGVDSERGIEFRSSVLACMLAQRVLQRFDLPAMLEAARHPDAFAPIFDPTAWRERGDDLRENAALMEAALALRGFDPAEARR